MREYLLRLDALFRLLYWALLGLATTASAAIQPVWTVHYNSGLARATNQVVAMALDASGNIVVAGSSTAAAGDYDYLTLKYAPDGKLLWSQRYASVSNRDDRVRSMALDREGNILVTGTSETVKYANDGALQWIAHFPGRDVAIGPEESIYVTGFSEADFATVKLASNGSNIWMRTADLYANGWPDRSDRVVVDESGNVYVAGSTTWGCSSSGIGTICYAKFGAVKYDAAGNRLWSTPFPPEVSLYVYEVVALAVREDRLYCCGTGNLGSFYTALLGTNGTVQWAQKFGVGGGDGLGNGVSAMILPDAKRVCVTGGRHWDVNGVFNVSYATFMADETGTPVWSSPLYSNGGAYGGTHQAKAMALDSAGNVYVTGHSDSPAGGADWATIKYNPDGQEQWVRRYDGSAHGNDEARAIAVDASGAVYVAGTQTTTNGSIETVLIKYIDLTNIELLPNGTAILRFIGPAGAPCRLQGSANMSDWSDVLSGVVGNDGIARFEDTNASASQVRFYRMASP